MTDMLRGWRILLVGGSGGIGAAVAQALLSEGVDELITAPSVPQARADRLRTEHVDLSNLASVEALAQRLADVPLNAVINCAGVNGNRRLLEGDWVARVRREMEVNYFGMLNLAAAFGPALAARPGGRFMTLLSFLSHVNLPAMASYCASKAAAHSVLQALRAEWAAAGVTVCGVYPTAVDTSMSKGLTGAKQSPQELAREMVQALVDGKETLYPGEAAGAIRGYLADPLHMQLRMLG